MSPPKKVSANNHGHVNRSLSKKATIVSKPPLLFLGLGVLIVLLIALFSIAAQSGYLGASLWNGNELLAQGTLPVGSACTSNDQCVSYNCMSGWCAYGTTTGSPPGGGWCGDGSCNNGETSSWCPSDCGGGGAITSGKSLGSTCGSGSECASYICTGGYCSTSASGTKTQDQTCNASSECVSPLYCYWASGSTQGTCTSSGGSGTIWGTKLVGETCSTSAECSSNYCNWSNGVGTCASSGGTYGTKATGETCTSSSECSSSYCSWISGGSNGVCATYTTGAKTVGEICNSSSECASSNCYWGSGSTQGTCAAPGTGSTTACNYNNICDSGESTGSCASDCSSSTGTTQSITLNGTVYKNSQYIDPTTGAVRTCTSPNAWMKEPPLSTGERGYHCMPNYTQLTYDKPPTSCTGTLWAGASNVFENDYCGTTKLSTTTPVTQKANGQSCSVASECSGGYCTNSVCSSTSAVSLKTNGQTCTSNGECQSNSCGTTSRVCETATTTLKGIGSTCSAGSECSSGSCTGGKCVTALTTTTCGDKICSGGENSSTCPADCGTATTETCGNNFCGTGETTTSCPADCKSGPTTETCGNNFCGTGETPTSCPADCTATTPVTTKVTGQCNSGETCSGSAWCQNGKQCYKTDGSFTCTNGWSTACAVGTKYCSPTDTNCIEPGATGSLNGWCKDSLECFTADGSKKLCQPWSTDFSKPAQCPAGSKLCAAGDANCVEPKSYGPITGWCKNSQSCYKKDGSGIYCAPWGDYIATPTIPMGTGAMPATNMQPVCPADTGLCNPTDKNCVEIGSTGPSTGWCASGGKQCYVGDKLSCVSWSESCPADAKVCRSTDTNCVEPGQYSAVPTATNQYSYWCGGSGSVQCYDEKDGRLFCGQVNGSDPSAWNKFLCPSGTNRCRKDDKYCLGKVGATGPGGSWCAVGWSKYNDDGTVTCVASDTIVSPGLDPLPVPPESPKLCILVQTPAFDPATKTCKTYPTPCDVPAGWSELKTNQSCMNGKLLTPDDGGIDEKEIARSKLKGMQRGVEDLERKLARVPDHVSGVQLLSDAVKKAKETLGLIQSRIEKNFVGEKSSIVKDMQNFWEVTLVSLNEKMNNLLPNIGFATLKRDIEREISRRQMERDRLGSKDTRFADKLDDYIEKMESLLSSAENQQGKGLEKISEVLRREMEEFAKVASDYWSNRTDGFMVENIRKLEANVEFALERISAGEGLTTRVKELFEKFQSAVEKAKVAVESNLPSAGELIKKAWSVQEKLANEMNDREFVIEDDEDRYNIDDVFDGRFNETSIRDIIAQLVKENLALLVKPMLQELTLKAAEIQEQAKVEIAALKQSIDNLTHLKDELQQEIVAIKNQILNQVATVNTELKVASVPETVKTEVEKAIELVTIVNWCGDKGPAVEAEIESLTLALEDNTFSAEDARQLRSAVDSHAQENNEECYRNGASPFRDTPLHEWYFTSASWNQENGLIKGDAGAGTFRPADVANLAETIVMATRVFDIPVGTETTITGPKPPGEVPAWTIPYVNAALENGYTFSQSLSAPITREEAAQVFYALGSEFFDTDSADAAPTFKDASKIDLENRIAVNALAGEGIIKGRPDGSFDPTAPLLRSEFSIINQRTIENVVNPEE